MPTFPEFDAAALVSLNDAFNARSKAFTYRAPGWAISRDLETGSERFNVDADRHHRQLRLSVWADGTLWFRMCSGRAKKGWDFMLSFEGDCMDLNAPLIVEQFLASITSDADTLLATWQNANPIVERYESNV